MSSPTTRPRAQWPKKAYVALSILMLLPMVAAAKNYTLLGYEGIPTLGSPAFTNGQPPPVADYVTTHCRYIDVMNTSLGEYFLRYPLEIPNGATITKVAVFIADFNPTGAAWIYLRSRPWASRDPATTRDITLTSSTIGDQLVDMGTTNVVVDTQTNEYWIDISPINSASPGQLCVYSVQVTYN